MTKNRFRPYRLVLTASMIALATGRPAAAQATRYVALCGDDAWTGLSAACAGPNGPKRTIQAAIDASFTGDEVVIADGTYTGTGNRDLVLAGRSLRIRRASGNAADCVIDSGGSEAEPHRGFLIEGPGTGATVLERLTITGGYIDRGGAIRLIDAGAPRIEGCVLRQNTSDPGMTGGSGGAVRIDACSPVFVDCEFNGNTAMRRTLGGFGGAVRIEGASVPRFTGCTFRANQGHQGGAVDLATGSGGLFEGCAFEQNVALNIAGALSTFQAGPLTISGCSFAWNSSTDPALNGGGAVAITGGALCTIRGSSFIDNSTARLAGALWLTQGATGDIRNCTFSRNSAVSVGGVAVTSGSQGAFVNCVFDGNGATSGPPGGALWVGDGAGPPSAASVVNCTFALNTAGPAGGGGLGATQSSVAAVTNSIFWQNTPPQIGQSGAAIITVSASDVQGGWPGVGNINADPLFAGLPGCAYSLQAGSPCIAAGNVPPPGVTTDVCGNPRIVGGDIDIGATEFQGAPCYANCDGSTIAPVLNVNDFVCFQTRYTAGDTRANCDNSTTQPVLNVNDFICFQAAFATGCP